MSAPILQIHSNNSLSGLWGKTVIKAGRLKKMSTNHTYFCFLGSIKLAGRKKKYNNLIHFVLNLLFSGFVFLSQLKTSASASSLHSSLFHDSLLCPWCPPCVYHRGGPLKAPDFGCSGKSAPSFFFFFFSGADQFLPKAPWKDDEALKHNLKVPIAPAGRVRGWRLPAGAERP